MIWVKEERYSRTSKYWLMWITHHLWCIELWNGGKWVGDKENFLSSLLHTTWFPARDNDYQSVTGSGKIPFAFSTTRWTEDKPVADGFIELWLNLKKGMEFWKKLHKSKQPKNKSNERWRVFCKTFFSQWNWIFQLFCWNV